MPLTYLAQFFGFQVAWNGVTHTAAVTSTAAEEETAVTKLPQLVYSELESLMAQQAAQYQTKDNVCPCCGRACWKWTSRWAMPPAPPSSMCPRARPRAPCSW
mgnify:CR=1 FL=1